MSRMAQKDEGRALGAETSARLPSPAFWLRIFAVQDLLMLAYLLVICRLVWGATGRPDQAQCAHLIYLCLGIVALGCWLARGTRALPHAARWIIYRLALIGVLIEDYL